MSKRKTGSQIKTGAEHKATKTRSAIENKRAAGKQKEATEALFAALDGSDDRAKLFSLKAALKKVDINSNNSVTNITILYQAITNKESSDIINFLIQNGAQCSETEIDALNEEQADKIIAAYNPVKPQRRTSKPKKPKTDEEELAELESLGEDDKPENKGKNPQQVNLQAKKEEIKKLQNEAAAKNAGPIKDNSVKNKEIALGTTAVTIGGVLVSSFFIGMIINPVTFALAGPIFWGLVAGGVAIAVIGAAVATHGKWTQNTITPEASAKLIAAYNKDHPDHEIVLLNGSAPSSHAAKIKYEDLGAASKLTALWAGVAATTTPDKPEGRAL